MLRRLVDRWRRGRERAKAELILENAFRIVSEYGGVLERASHFGGTVAPESTLPYPRDTITTAIKMVLITVDDSAQREHLKAGYVPTVVLRPRP